MTGIKGQMYIEIEEGDDEASKIVILSEDTQSLIVK